MIHAANFDWLCPSGVVVERAVVELTSSVPGERLLFTLYDAASRARFEVFITDKSAYLGPDRARADFRRAVMEHLAEQEVEMLA